MATCLEHRCPVLVTSGRCPAHSKAKRQQERRYTSQQAHSDTGTTFYPPVHYGRRWQREAKRYLAMHPYCVDCQAEGHTHGLATEVDHDTPHQGDPALFWNEDNWRSRCKPHHSQKTAREVGFGG